MALVLEANYSKKLGLPGYSSHQYSVTVRTELSDISQVEAESRRLYALLQANVDRDIQQTGFLPVQNGNGHTNGHVNGNGQSHHLNGNANGHTEKWECSDKQKELILKVVEENNLDKAAVEKTSQDMFGKSVKRLNRMDASSLIDELLRQVGKPNTRRNYREKARAR